MFSIPDWPAARERLKGGVRVCAHGREAVRVQAGRRCIKEEINGATQDPGDYCDSGPERREEGVAGRWSGRG